MNMNCFRNGFESVQVLVSLECPQVVWANKISGSQPFWVDSPPQVHLSTHPPTHPPPTHRTLPPPPTRIPHAIRRHKITVVNKLLSIA